MISRSTMDSSAFLLYVTCECHAKQLALFVRLPPNGNLVSSTILLVIKNANSSFLESLQILSKPFNSIRELYLPISLSIMGIFIVWIRTIYMDRKRVTNTLLNLGSFTHMWMSSSVSLSSVQVKHYVVYRLDFWICFDKS